MKIIISPSKSQKHASIYEKAIHEPVFYKEAYHLNQRLNKLSKNALGRLMGIDGELLEQTFANIKTFDIANPNPAIHAYTGLVYKYLDLNAYNNEQIRYMNNHLVILSAMYGALKPLDGIKPYRLDMKMPLMKTSLYKYWKKPMTHYFHNEPLLIDLTSNEYSKLLPSNKITLRFLEKKNNQYKNIATYSKIARGRILDLMIKNQITEPDQIKTLSFEGYHYNLDLSDGQTIVFTRP
ncbi:YaaA family protein [Petrocella sp. FN5]|uniref:YaaA family protein n=1 Tax=Petrocella sp. FN5 TaxID=3032002 RepID=UPI0023D9FD69|nr:YaaA family protein [Petrocella sp. FN5]MDF1616578.1 YaaA family protein [Petrocella sp. FN5]